MLYPEADVEKTQEVEPRELRNLKLKQEAYQNQCTGAMRAMSDREILAELFSYHPPNEATIPKYAAINQAAKNFAEIVLQNCPPGSDRSAAIRQIREARMTANAAISLNGLSL